MAITTIMKAARLLPASAALKLLQKYNPKFKNYFANAAAYGYDVNNALDYLNERFEGDQPFRQQLEQGEANGQLRPDERISKNALENAETPRKIARSAAAIGGGALLGGVPGATAGVAAEAIPQAQQPQQQPQREPGAREQALKRHAEMNKKRKLIDTLTQDFENEYGQGNVSASGFPGASQESSANERIQQGTPGGDKSDLLRALQETKRLLGG